MIARILVTSVSKVYSGSNDRGVWRIRRLSGVVDLLTDSGEFVQSLPNADVSFRGADVDRLDEVKPGAVVTCSARLEPRYGVLNGSDRARLLGYQLWADGNIGVSERDQFTVDSGAKVNHR